MSQDRDRIGETGGGGEGRPDDHVDGLEELRRQGRTVESIDVRDPGRVPGNDLIALRPEVRKAVFRRTETAEEVAISCDMIHVRAPMGAPDFIKRGPLAGPADWVDVDRSTLRHARSRNIFGLGDASNLPTSKTGAAVREQTPVVVEVLISALRGEPLVVRYDGYTSCALVTGCGNLVLAEFDYDRNPRETFPLDQSKERRSMYLLKKYALPALYWHGMLRGRA